MPGISFICNFVEPLEQKEAMIMKALDSLLHDERYKRETLQKEKSFLLACTRYKEYPITSFENDEYSIHLEGPLYGKNDASLNLELNNLARLIFQTEAKTTEPITNWLLNTDGDFVVFIWHKKSNQIAIVNDTLGRLPLYYYQKSSEELLVSRELRFITNLISDKRFDRMAIAQHLLFGFPLGKRTLLEKVHRLEPASLLRLDVDRKLAEVTNLHYRNFDIMEHAHNSLKRNASEAASLFVEGCKKRSNPNGKNVVSLSGGLDSRGVAAGFYKARIPFSAVTFLDFDESYKSDIEIARQVASLLKVDWQVFHLDALKGKHFLKLLRTKSGLNDLSMSYAFSFCEKVIQTFGSGIWDFHGEGNHVLLHDHLRPPIYLRSVDDLVNYFTSTPYLSLRTIANLTALREHEIIDELRDRFSTYPERDPNKQFAHFRLYEKYFKSNFEGEDRDRLYFWITSPCYYNRFFDYVINCPDVQKQRDAFYREFIVELSPEAAAIRRVGRSPIISQKTRIEDFLGSVPLIILRRLPQLANTARRLRKLGIDRNPYQPDSMFMICIREQKNNCRIINEYLSDPVLEDVIENCDRYDRAAIQRLFAVTSLIEDLEGCASTIEKYYETDFV